MFYLCKGLFFSPSFFFFQAEDGIRDLTVTGVQTCALPILKACDRSDRHHLARVVARFEAGDVRSCHSKAVVSLRNDLIGPPEVIEDVDVGQPKIDLQYFEQPLGRHTEVSRSHANDVSVDVWSGAAKGREHAFQARICTGRRNKIPGGRL